MEPKVVELEFEKETPGALRFKEIKPEGQPGIFNTIYIRKSAFTGNPTAPSKIRVTLEAL